MSVMEVHRSFSCTNSMCPAGGATAKPIPRPETAGAELIQVTVLHENMNQIIVMKAQEEDEENNDFQTEYFIDWESLNSPYKTFSINYYAAIMRK